MILHTFFLFTGAILGGLGLIGALFFPFDRPLLFFHGFLLGMAFMAFIARIVLFDEEEAMLTAKLLSFLLITVAIGSALLWQDFTMLAPVVAALTIGMVGVALCVRQEFALHRDLAPRV